MIREKIVYLTYNELKDLPEYSCSLPTGTIEGKRWKRDMNFGNYKKNPDLQPDWVMGEYVDHPDPQKIGIEWSRIIVS